MIWHPLTVTIGFLDILGWLIYGAAVWRLFAALPGWRPEISDYFQLQRERALELAVFQGRWTMVLQAFVFVLLLIGISNAWPPLVPGAMCGTGLMQAMGPAGERTLIFRGAALGLFYAWRVLENLNRSHPQGALTALAARVLLLPGPVMAMATYAFGQAATAVQTTQPVTCCAVLLTPVSGESMGALLASGTAGFWVTLCLGGATVVIAWGWVQWRRPGWGGSWQRAGMTLVTVAWVVVAVKALTKGVAPYIYQVRWHSCPWCLFLSDHWAVGGVFFAALGLVAAEAIAGWVAGSIAEQRTTMRAAAYQRVNRAGLRLLMGVIVFVIAAAGPALLWRVRFGIWLH